MFDKDGIKRYVGGNSGNSYSAGLANIERKYAPIDIDHEFEKDECSTLLSKLEKAKFEPNLEQKEKSQRQDNYSHLKKYICFKRYKRFIAWLSRQQQKNDVSRSYAEGTARAAASCLHKGLSTLSAYNYKETDCFSITDPEVFQNLYDRCYSAAKEYDTSHGHRDYRNGLDYYLAYLRGGALEEMDILNNTASNERPGTNIAKNTILYGPPGTGKTYNTVRYAVAIIENKKLAEVNEDYDDVLKRYNRYKAEGFIEFTTFHQSYGYEEFIEGIKPVLQNDSDEQTDIQYEIAPGLFKSFCEKASRPTLKKQKMDIGLNNTPTIWKVSLERTGDNPTRTECMDNDHIRVGYDSYGGDITSDTNFDKGGKNVINAFVSKMKIGDIVLSCYSSTTIDAVGVITGDYEWHDEYDRYKRLRNVNWIVKGIREDITEINNGATLTLSSVYRLNISLADVMDIITKNAPAATEVSGKNKNFVFIIDEINRGNISKILGELITLIEPSKRIGQPEGMKAKLPYSHQLFGVPDNVYLIGTMNTADRSIAAIDTALRRRFQFKEMMPDENVLAGIKVGDISVKEMLLRMNKRITVLYDREHTIGHAYFIPLQSDPTIKTLASIFSDNIIPLLQEYFYEDYEKIRLVLGDHKKTNIEEQFIAVKANDYKELFGDADYGFNEMKSYEINYFAFDNIEAYRSI